MEVLLYLYLAAFLGFLNETPVPHLPPVLDTGSSFQVSKVPDGVEIAPGHGKSGIGAPAMSKSTGCRRSGKLMKLEKPYPDFPLFPCASSR